MDMRLPLRKLSSLHWVALRARMLRETEAFLEAGLSRTEPQIVIPTIRVGSGSFPRGYSDTFWSQVLATS
jgi:hypothetical protein